MEKNWNNIKPFDLLKQLFEWVKGPLKGKTPEGKKQSGVVAIFAQ